MFWLRLLGGFAGALGALLWTPVILFLFWLPRLQAPDLLAYGCAVAFVLALGLVGVRRPRWGASVLAVVALSWLGLAILLWLQIIELA
ncbi:MAG: hypothetical protein ACYCWW_13475 [Deltaproteobacteria bacterium]